MSRLPGLNSTRRRKFYLFWCGEETEETNTEASYSSTPCCCSCCSAAAYSSKRPNKPLSAASPNNAHSCSPVDSCCTHAWAPLASWRASINIPHGLSQGRTCMFRYNTRILSSIRPFSSMQTLHLTNGRRRGLRSRLTDSAQISPSLHQFWSKEAVQKLFPKFFTPQE